MNNNNNLQNIDDEDNNVHDADTESESTQSSEDDRRERRPFDVTLPPTHQYLRLNGVSSSIKFYYTAKVLFVNLFLKIFKIW